MTGFERGGRRSIAARLLLALMLAWFGIVATPAFAQDANAGEAASPRAHLRAFRSDQEFSNFLRRIRARQQAEAEAQADSYTLAPPPPPPPPPPPAAGATAAPSITNTQEVGVDEGGIVKIRGDILVILRRGRLFTVSIAGGEMRAIDAINAFPPGVDGRGDWYDEMLIAGDRVIVVGYSYARGGTEINRFRLSPDGRLRFEDAHQLRSNDYYSSRNYASRLIGNRLIFYTPLNLSWRDDPLEALPGVKRWGGDAGDRAFRPIAGPRQIYIARDLLRARDAEVSTLHSVTTCDVTAPDLGCSATGVIGPGSRTFYVSGNAVYLWISDAWAYDDPPANAFSHIYRLSLSDEPPSAIGARGAPVDQFSFREDAADAMLNVLVRAGSGGDAMWGAEASEGTIALLRLPLSEFGDGSQEARQRYYRLLPKPEGHAWSFQNRFVGEHVVYGYGGFTQSYGEATPVAVAVPVRGGPIAQLPLRHAPERIEALGADALVVGSGQAGSLGFSAIELTRDPPRLGDAYAMPAAAQGEARSHAFFFRPDPGSPDGASGVLGLPIAR
ncbi:MAG: beta-propeller domain-containing protein, partial [Sphingomonadaceae bacterium]|nr:beta-propeller domain-containing protein [Sphingomonadaceae bacterium]